MTSILTINPGSASIKLVLYACDQDRLTVLRRKTFPTSDNAEELLQNFLQETLTTVATPVVVHRVVHGGLHSVSTRIIDDEVEAQIRDASIFAPLHNPQTLGWIHICKKLFGTNVKQVAVTDTSFFADLPRIANTYALPRALCQQHGIRRLGFHGIAHRSMWRQFCEKRPDLVNGGKIVTFQLGAGASIAATKNGKPVDTSMGFTPLEGLVMATRCGDVDPGIFLYLMQQGFSIDALNELLSHQSGLLGLSERSSDFSELMSTNTESARLALDVYAYRAKKYLGSYLGALGGADAIIFGGGVGENVPNVRAQIIRGFEFCNIKMDNTRNNVVGQASLISADGSNVDIWVIPPDEAFELAYEAHLLTKNA